MLSTETIYKEVGLKVHFQPFLNNIATCHILLFRADIVLTPRGANKIIKKFFKTSEEKRFVAINMES